MTAADTAGASSATTDAGAVSAGSDTTAAASRPGPPPVDGPLPHITEERTAAVVDEELALEAARAAFAAAVDGPVFPSLAVHASDPSNRFSLKPSASATHAGVKIGTYWPGNAERGLPRHHCALLLFAQTAGRLAAVLEVGTANACRTATANTLAVDLPARPEAGTLAVFGTGHGWPRSGADTRRRSRNRNGRWSSSPVSSRTSTGDRTPRPTPPTPTAGRRIPVPGGAPRLPAAPMNADHVTAQAPHQVRAVCRVRPVAEVLVVARTAERAECMAAALTAQGHQARTAGAEEPVPGPTWSSPPAAPETTPPCSKPPGSAPVRTCPARAPTPPANGQ